MAWLLRPVRRAASPAWSPTRTSTSPCTRGTLTCPSEDIMFPARGTRRRWRTGPTCVEESWTGTWRSLRPSTSSASLVGVQVPLPKIQMVIIDSTPSMCAGTHKHMHTESWPFNSLAAYTQTTEVHNESVFLKSSKGSYKRFVIAEEMFW